MEFSVWFSNYYKPVNPVVWLLDRLSGIQVNLLDFKARGIFLTGVTSGVTLSSISIYWVFLSVPISPKQSENPDKNYSSLN